MVRKRLKFRKRLIMTYVLILILPTLAIFTIILHNLRKDNYDRYLTTMSSINKQMLDHFQSALVDATTCYNLFYIDNNLLQILGRQQYEEPSQQYRDVAYVKTLIRQIISVNRSIENVVFISRGGLIFDNSGEDAEYIAMLLGEQEAGVNFGEWTLSPVRYQTLHRREVLSATLSRNFANPFTGEDIGFIHITLDVTTIFSAMYRNESSYGGGYMLYQNGEVRYSSQQILNRAVVDHGIQDRLYLEQDEVPPFRIAIDHTDMMLFGVRYAPNDLYLLQYFPSSILIGDLISTLWVYLPLIAAMVVISFALSASFSQEISKPVVAVIKAMEQTDANNFRAIPMERSDELGMLISGFNTMSLRLERNIHITEQSKRSEQMMQMKLLQAQVNPHFISNSLNLISAIAQLDNMPQILTISTGLANMLYYNLKGSEIVTIAEELEQIKRYVGIQQMRFPNKLNVTYDVAQELLSQKIIKFALQPIVENSIFHGLEKKSGVWQLGIAVQPKCQHLLIRIADNGIGIPPEELHEICKRLEENKEDFLLGENTRNIGILNVYWRLKSRYDFCKMTIESTLGVGTVFTVELSREVHL